MKSGILVGLFALLFLPAAGSSPASAETLTFQEGDGGAHSATQAAYAQWIGGTNYATSTTMMVSVDVVVADFTPGKRSYVRFSDFIGDGVGQVPAGSTIQSAFLQLTRVNSSTNGAHVFVINSAWDESTLTGDNTPGYDYPATLDAMAAGGSGPQATIITAAVQAWVSGTPNWGLMLTAGYSPTTFSESFYSDDAVTPANRPLLSVTFTPPPGTPVEPSTWGKVKALYR